MVKELEAHFVQDIEAIQKISVVPSILQVICKTTGMRFAAVARVTEERWIACAVKDEIAFGLIPGGELEVETTICHEIRQSGELVVISHVSEDKVYHDHHTPKFYGLESYISVPIFLKDGSFFGTLCAIDPAPANINNEETIEMFKLYAELISMHLVAVHDNELTVSTLKEERRIASFRDQFIAILGHDLNNPLNAVMVSAQMLKQISRDETVLQLAGIINDSSRRMNELIEDVLDFAKGHLGDGIQVIKQPSENLGQLLSGILSEYKLIHPERLVEIDIQELPAVNCDDRRIGQVFSNLLGNAYKYGDTDKPIKVFSGYEEGNFVLSVSNACRKIPEQDLVRLFQPFYHGVITGTKSLGLGLYIAHEIAKAHGGSLEVISTDEVTTFTFRLPDC
jgi:signal transduction histidine kinase